MNKNLHQPLALARLLWFAWPPWLAGLFGFAVFGPDASREIVRALLGVSWLATGILMPIAANAFRGGLAALEPDVLLERRIFGGFWSQIDLVCLIGAATDARVKSNPILSELASRHVALTAGTVTVFCIAAAAMIAVG